MHHMPSDVSQVNNLDDLTGCWPVTTKEYSDIAEFMYSGFFIDTELFNTLDRQCLFTETSSLNYLINCVHYQLALQRSATNKRKFNFGNVSEIYNFATIKDRITDIKKVQMHDLAWTSVKALVKDLKINFSTEINFLHLLSRRSKKNIWCHNIRKDFQYDHIFTKDVRLKNVDYILKKSIQQVSKKELPEAYVIKEHLKNFLVKIREKYTLDLTDRNVNEIHQFLYKRVVFNRMLILELTKYFTKASRIYVGSSAKPTSKILSFACQNAGGKSTSFSHGNELGLHVEFQFERPTSEFGCYNEFVFSSPLSTEKYTNLVNLKRFPIYSDTHLITSVQPTYRRLTHKLKHCSSKSGSKPGNKVMLVGFPMSPHRYWNYQNAFFYDALKLEIEICIKLTDAGYNVIYKAHPDRLGFVENIIGKYVHKVVTDKFEDVVNTADQIIFHYTHTSTFGFALCTDKPILLCSSEIAKIDPEDLSKLESRIQILNYPSAGEEGEHLGGLIAAVKNPMTFFSHHKILEFLQ